MRDLYKSKPDHYLSFLIGHESKGSLLQLLKVSVSEQYISRFWLALRLLPDCGQVGCDKCVQCKRRNYDSADVSALNNRIRIRIRIRIRVSGSNHMREVLLLQRFDGTYCST